jgi:peptide chain release factor 1
VASGGGDPLLQLAHLVRQRRLVAHRRGHPAEQGRHLGSGLGEAENIVDEQQHVLLLDIPEVLGHGERGQRDPEPGTRRLIHLTEHQRGLGDDAGLGHLQEEVVTFAGALPDPSEHRHAAEVLRNAIDHLLDQHRLTDPGSTEQADFATLHVRGQQVDDLDAGLKDLVLDSSWSNGGAER